MLFKKRFECKPIASKQAHDNFNYLIKCELKPILT